MRISDWSSDVCSSDLCSKPVTPYCASDGELVGGYITAERCRVRIVDHLRQLEDYQNCLSDLVVETGKDMDKLKRLIGQEPRSEEHKSELQSLMRISYAVCCSKKKQKHSDKEK